MDRAGISKMRSRYTDGVLCTANDPTYLHSGRAAAMYLAPSALIQLLARLRDVNAPMVGIALLISMTPDISLSPFQAVLPR